MIDIGLISFGKETPAWDWYLFFKCTNSLNNLELIIEGATERKEVIHFVDNREIR